MPSPVNTGLQADKSEDCKPMDRYKFEKTIVITTKTHDYFAKMVNSTRRLRARPKALLLLAMGLVCP